MAEQFRDQMIRPRRSAVVEILRRAADRGDLPPDVDTELLLDVYAGAVFYRVLVSGEPVTDLLAEQLIGLLLDGKRLSNPASPRTPRQQLNADQRRTSPRRSRLCPDESPKDPHPREFGRPKPGTPAASGSRRPLIVSRKAWMFNGLAR
jgi:hypothetical protein